MYVVVVVVVCARPAYRIYPISGYEYPFGLFLERGRTGTCVPGISSGCCLSPIFVLPCAPSNPRKGANDCLELVLSDRRGLCPICSILP